MFTKKIFLLTVLFFGMEYLAAMQNGFDTATTLANDSESETRCMLIANIKRVLLALQAYDFEQELDRELRDCSDADIFLHCYKLLDMHPDLKEDLRFYGAYNAFRH